MVQVSAKIFKSKVFLAGLLLALPLVGCGPSQRELEEEKDYIGEQARARALAEARGAIDRKELAEEIGLQWPISEITATTEEVRDQVIQQVNQEEKERFPRSRVLEFRSEAEEKFPAREIGDEVSFTIREGRGSSPEVSGAFLDIAEQRVKIGDRWILKSDMRQEDLAMLDENVRERLRNNYINNQTARYERRRRDFIAERRRELYGKAMLEAGYQRWRDKYVDASEVLEEAVDSQAKRIADRTTPDIERQMLKDAGFVLKEGEWVPSLRKRLF